MCDLVSIIIPAYNSQEHIRQAVESALAQSYTRLEIIVVDDGSTDATPVILNQLALSDSRLRIITQSNAGVSAARNRALDVARGEWLMFLDSDDLLQRQCIEILLKAALHTGAGIVCGQMTRKQLPDSLPSAPSVEVFTSEEAIEHTLYRTRGNSGPWAKLYRRKAAFRGMKLRDVRFVEHMRYEDLEAVARLYSCVPKIAYVKAPIYFYRPNPHSFIHNFSPQRLDALKATAMLEEFIKAHHPALTAAAADRRFSAAANILTLLWNNSPTSYPKAEKECREIIKSHRFKALFSIKNRMRNKIFALMSYTGFPILKFLWLTAGRLVSHN